ncbi:MAG: hypothetical protein Q9195_006838 [Heterodermia aff. obscurata]
MSQELQVLRNGLQAYQSSGVDLANPPALDDDYCSDTDIRDVDIDDYLTDEKAEEKICAQIESESQMFPENYFEDVQMLMLTAIGQYVLDGIDVEHAMITWEGAGHNQTEDITNRFRMLCENASGDLHQLANRAGTLTYEGQAYTWFLSLGEIVEQA